MKKLTEGKWVVVVGGWGGVGSILCLLVAGKCRSDTLEIQVSNKSQK